jgi:hypothetical protein
MAGALIQFQTRLLENSHCTGREKKIAVSEFMPKWKRFHTPGANVLGPPTLRKWLVPALAQASIW